MRSSIIAIALISLAFSASAEPTEAPVRSEKTSAPSEKASDCARAKRLGRACSLVFDDPEAVEGAVVGASGSDVIVRKPPTHGSLIRLRTSFRAEILRSATLL